ncbi:helix-turn-helix domain-containing protein [Actinoplanes sp. G11-F43]|uniref:helix-turn-helix domain-containing protein n=1 Tax=Actinoplanes sp. G11-F43 TaxID=3424130 RepID=UPI003D32B5D1
MQNFGHLLRRLRRDAVLTQEELAELTGLSIRSISDLERGVRAPRRSTERLLSTALRLPASAASEFTDAARYRRFAVEAA